MFGQLNNRFAIILFLLNYKRICEVFNARKYVFCVLTGRKSKGQE
ncbi:hypothetical protein FM106_04080 [Brachybacterium faecium]|nr:hypothetical protein FM106_04080 [Brachybacterium faecium]